MPTFRTAVLILVLAPCLLSAATQPSDQAQQLKSLTLEQLGNLEVTTQSKEPTEVWNTPAAIYVLTADDIRRSGVTSVPDALRLVPGVNVFRVNGSRNWAVGIRGLADQFSRYVLVLIDGRSVYTPLFGGVLWTINNVMLEDIDRIEVIRGPGGTIWGADAVNGVINIITKHSQDTKGSLISAGGGNVDRNTEDFRYGSERDGWTWRAGAFGFVRGPEHHIQNQPEYDWSRDGQAGFRLDHNSGPSEFTFQGDAYWGKFGDAQSLSTYQPPSTFISYQSTNVSGGNLRTRWRRRFDNKSDIYLQAYWSHDHRIGSNFGEERDTYDVDFLHRLPATPHQQFTWGAGIRISPSTTKHTVPTDGFDPADRTESIYSGFLQEELQLVPGRFSLIAGSKLEHNNYTGFEYQPNARLLFTPSDKFSAWASIARAVRIPDRVNEDIHNDIFVRSAGPVFLSLAGNHNLVSERLIAYEGGFRTLVHPRLYLSASGFYNAYRNIIAFGPLKVGSPNVPPFPPGTRLFTVQYINGIHGATDGAEIAPDFQAASFWRIRPGLSYLKVDLHNEPGSTGTLTLTSLRGSSPTYQAFIQSQIDLPHHFEFDQSFRYVDSLPAQKVRAYTTADARLGWNPSRSFSLSITGQNLLQPHHAEFGIDPPPTVSIRRGVYAKLVWSY
ncbi:TonB-dependent receptor plug domain-containing protein [Occallatibacter savannae]|uniref:TonB-dependent receptor plug domain-containing protein n=1 Tax=Occallatibacter savannae TaxID=1002691 RepID=UPI000D686B03|nr:TonB-dependent receptor [Occallatibacter savannae]